MKTLFLCIGWTLAVAFSTLWIHGGYVEGPENCEKMISVIEGKEPASKVLSVDGTQGAGFEGRFSMRRDHYNRVVVLAQMVRIERGRKIFDSMKKHEAAAIIHPTVPDLELSPIVKAVVLARVTEDIQRAKEKLELAKAEAEQKAFIWEMEVAKQQVEIIALNLVCEKEELELRLQETSNKQIAAEIEELKLFAEKQKLMKESGLKKK